jgi:hypothetical protein
MHPGFVFIPYHGMTPGGLRAQYLIPNLSLSVNAHPSIHPLRSGHVIMQSHEISANSPLAERKQIADRKLLCRILLEKPSFLWTDFFTRLGPQIRLPLYQILVLTVCNDQKTTSGNVTRTHLSYLLSFKLPPCMIFSKLPCLTSL